MTSYIGRTRLAFATAGLIGVALVGATALVAHSQDKEATPKPTEGKKAAKTVDIHCKVLTEKGEPLTSGDVLVSLDDACWPQSTPDPSQSIGDTGEVSFGKLPACFATFIMKVEGYTFLQMEVNGKKQTTRRVDLKEYKTPIVIIMKKL